MPTLSKYPPSFAISKTHTFFEHFSVYFLICSFYCWSVWSNERKPITISDKGCVCTAPAAAITKEMAWLFMIDHAWVPPPSVLPSQKTSSTSIFLAQIFFFLSPSTLESTSKGQKWPSSLPFWSFLGYRGSPEIWSSGIEIAFGGRPALPYYISTYSIFPTKFKIIIIIINHITSNHLLRSTRTTVRR